MVWTGPRMAVAHALALEIHVVIQVVSCRGLRLGMIIMIYKITSNIIRSYHSSPGDAGHKTGRGRGCR